MKNDLRDKANAGCISAIAWFVGVALAVAGTWTGELRYVGAALVVYMVVADPFARVARG